MKVNEIMRDENEKYVRAILEARDFVREKLSGSKPKMAIVLGSGLGGLASDPELVQKVAIDYSSIPHFPESAAPGHAGKLILANYHGSDVILLAGRAHFYEAAGIPGYTSTQAMRHITLPTRVLKGIGVEALVLSNAAGGLNQSIVLPELMISTSFLNRTGATPLMGLNIDALGPRFPPMGGDECNEELKQLFQKVAGTQGLNLREGIYVMQHGPHYEFTGECLEMRALGISALGMSTVPEIFAALHGYYSSEQYAEEIAKARSQGAFIPSNAYDLARRLSVIAISLISNVIGPDGKNKTDYKEVLDNAAKGASTFIPLVKGVIDEYHQEKA